MCRHAGAQAAESSIDRQRKTDRLVEVVFSASLQIIAVVVAVTFILLERREAVSSLPNLAGPLEDAIILSFTILIVCSWNSIFGLLYLSEILVVSRKFHSSIMTFPMFGVLIFAFVIFAIWFWGFLTRP